MDDVFDVPVNYENKEILFPAQLQQFGYSHRFAVEIYGTEIYYERDEEGEYRAIVSHDKLTKEMTPALLQAIAQAIEKVIR